MAAHLQGTAHAAVPPPPAKPSPGEAGLGYRMGIGP